MPKMLLEVAFKMLWEGKEMDIYQLYPTWRSVGNRFKPAVAIRKNGKLAGMKFDEATYSCIEVAQVYALQACEEVLKAGFNAEIIMRKQKA